tara:strand:- start:29103 stop:30218 length:1116 start_codon:yes stop_codon:yes gene_type:complete
MLRLLVLATLSLLVFRHIADYGAYDVLLFGILLGLILLLEVLLTTKRLGSAQLWLFLVSIVAIYFVSLLKNGLGVGTLFLPLALACLGIALQLNRDPQFYKAIWLMMVVVFAYHAVSILYFDMNPDDVVYGSKNHISTFYLSMTAAGYALLARKSRRLPLAPAVLCLVGCLLGQGSAGSVAGLVLFSGALYAILLSRFPMQRFTLLLIAVPVVVLVLSIGLVDYSNALQSYLWNQGYSLEIMKRLDLPRILGEDVRFEIWVSYIDRLDTRGLLLGFPFGAEFGFHENLHSSYLLLHQRGGVFSLLIFGFLIFILFELWKHSLVVFFCFLALIVRAAGDTVFYGVGVFDWVLILCAVSVINPSVSESRTAMK